MTAKNRFYQVPHCNGMGYRDPTALAWMRGVKAEGGWAVVCTEEVEIHHTSDIAPYIELRLWDDRDIPALARVADRIHEFGALAGIELAYNGPNGANSYGREVPLAPSAQCLWPPRTTTRSSTARRRPATRSPSGASSPSFSPSTGPDPLHRPRARARRRPAQSRSGSVRRTRFGSCGPDTELSDA